MFKKNKQLSIGIFIILGFTLSLVLILHTPQYIKKIYLLLGFEKVNPPLPVRIKIPKINVDAVIDHVGFASDGTMDVPTGPDNTAWFNLGPRPGEIGSSVIDGHSGFKNSIPAVFDNLYKLQKGDRIYIENDKGMISTFVVYELRSYNPNDSAVDVFNSNDGKAHLNLITCAGIWNEIDKTQSKRLVVFANRE